MIAVDALASPEGWGGGGGADYCTMMTSDRHKTILIGASLFFAGYACAELLFRHRLRRREAREEAARPLSSSPPPASGDGEAELHGDEQLPASEAEGCRINNGDDDEARDYEARAEFFEETRVTVISEEDETLRDRSLAEAYDEFDHEVIRNLHTLEDSKLLLRRTRVVSSLASRLMAAPDEDSCYQLCSELLVPLFKVDRCSYALKQDEHHIIVKGVVANKREHTVKIIGNSGNVKKLKDTMAGLAAETLKQQYCPSTEHSAFQCQRDMSSIGINTVLVTPILVNGSKFAGAIVICMEERDAFKYYDRLLIQDIASMLGANVYAKRMRKEATRSNDIAKEMLNCFVPPKIIEKIKVYWDDSSVEYMKRRTSQNGSITSTTLSVKSHNSDLDESENSVCDREKESGKERRRSLSSGMKRTLSSMDFLNMNGIGCDAGCVFDTSEMNMNNSPGSLSSTALYAEDAEDVVIIFSDIVGFSKLSLEMKPIDVMNMVQSLFCRFDMLCEHLGVSKLETIGDAYLATANLFDDFSSLQEAADAALDFAVRMIQAADEVMIPGKRFESLQIRVGIHVGPATCGVLGEAMPKFSLFGTAINLAARMEQTSRANCIRVTEDFYNLVATPENSRDELWGGREMIPIKNMGEVGSYLLDLDRRRTETW